MGDTPENEEITCSTKYIFLDVVQFTHKRYVEAQSDIVRALNKIVLETIKKNRIDEQIPVYIPTGDGICIALKNTEGRYPFDINMRIALDILAQLHAYNNEQADETRKFQIRIGLNANEDNLIIDINGRENLAGEGISLASRIMDKADGSQLLVGESVFDRLQQRQKYMDKFKRFSTVDKHGKPFRVYQFIEEGHQGLNIDAPQAFQITEQAEPKLSIRFACYLAHAIKNRDYFLQHLGGNPYTKFILLWVLAGDTVEEINSRGLRQVLPRAYRAGESSLQEQFAYYDRLDMDLLEVFGNLIFYDHLLKNGEYFEQASFIFVNQRGRDKLKQDWPDIWKKFGLEDQA